MVRKISRAAIAVSIAALLCSCGGGIKLGRSLKEYETDYSSVRAETITISGMENTEFEAALNEGLEKNLDSALVAFDTEAEAAEDSVRMGNKCVFESVWEEKYNKKDFLSLVDERYIYMGGAHGETVWLPENIDVAASKKVELKDLFADEGYESTLNRMINEMVTEHPDEYADLWEKPQIKESNQTDFYLEDGRLVIFYQPYDLSYYARGFVEFPLKLKDLSGYLKEEYRRLI